MIGGKFLYIINRHTFYTDLPSPPLNPTISSTLNRPSSSNITLDWDPPSSTGGVSVSYVLIISPTLLSVSSVTMETTSAQIIVSYNTPYDVTVRAVNCAGMSIASMWFTIPSIGKQMLNYCPHNYNTSIILSFLSILPLCC